MAPEQLDQLPIEEQIKQTWRAWAGGLRIFKRVPFIEEQLWAPFRQSLLHDLHDDGTDVDFGTGDGDILGFLLQHTRNTHLIGIDYSSEFLALAQERLANFPAEYRAGERVTLVEEDLTNGVPFISDSSAQRVTACYVFQYFTPEQQTRLLGTAYRILEPGGTLHMNTLLEGASFGPIARTIFTGGQVSPQIMRDLQPYIPVAQQLDAYARAGYMVNPPYGRVFDMIREAGFSDVQETGLHRLPIQGLPDPCGVIITATK